MQAHRMQADAARTSAASQGWINYIYVRFNSYSGKYRVIFVTPVNFVPPVKLIGDPIKPLPLYRNT